jgi:hypothetical protein
MSKINKIYLGALVAGALILVIIAPLVDGR